MLKVNGCNGTKEEFTYLHLGTDHTYGYEGYDDLDSNSNYFLDNTILSNTKIDVLQMPNAGYLYNDDALNAFYDFAEKITKVSKTNNYGGSDGRSKNGLTILCNSTMYQQPDGKYMYPYNLSIGHNKYYYEVDAEQKYLLIFVTQKTEKNSKTVPYSGTSKNGADLCMRVTMQLVVDKSTKQKQTKITYGVNRNYGKPDELFFCYNKDDTLSEENRYYGYDKIQLDEKSFKKAA